MQNNNELRFEAFEDVENMDRYLHRFPSVVSYLTQGWVTGQKPAQFGFCEDGAIVRKVITGDRVKESQQKGTREPRNVRIIIQNIHEHVNKSELCDSDCNLFKLYCDISLIFLGITGTFFQDKVAW